MHATNCLFLPSSPHNCLNLEVVFPTTLQEEDTKLYSVGLRNKPNMVVEMKNSTPEELWRKQELTLLATLIVIIEDS